MDTEGNKTKLNQCLSSITFAKLTFRLKAKTHVIIPPFWGSALRGGFGNIFRRLGCVDHRRLCSECELSNDCAYCYIFETPRPDESYIYQGNTYVPHPFVLETTINSKNIYEPGDEFEFKLLIVGKGLKYFHYFIFLFMEMGKSGFGRGRGKYDVISITGLNKRNQWVPLFDPETRTLINNDCAQDIYCMQNNGIGDKVTISFITPLRIKHHSKLCDHISFDILIRNLLRRLTSLSCFHCGGSVEDIDFDEIIEESELVQTRKNYTYWHDWVRYSHRQNAKMNFGGVLGKTEFEGYLDSFQEILRLGEVLHVGKSTSFGFGQYKIEE